MSISRKIISRLKRMSLFSRRRNVCIHSTAHLHRQFSVRFFVEPEDRTYLEVGKHSMLNMQVMFESAKGKVLIGNNAYIGSGVQIICREQIKIGDDVTVAWGAVFYDHNSHSLNWKQRSKVVRHFYDTYGVAKSYEGIDWSDVGSAPISIGDKVWIGFNAVILKGVTIGEGAVVAACSVVTRDVEPYTVVAGNPAKVVKRIEGGPVVHGEAI